MDKTNVNPLEGNEQRSWCQLFEERINDWLDERRPLQAELFFDETPPDGAADSVILPSSFSAEFSGSSVDVHQFETLEIAFPEFIRRLRTHVESCSDCGVLAQGYGDLQKVIWSLKAPEPDESLLAGALAKIVANKTSAPKGDQVPAEHVADQLPEEDQATRDTVEFRSNADTVSMSRGETESPVESFAESPAETSASIPHFDTATITGAANKAARPESIDTKQVHVAENRRNVIIRRGLQLAAVAATLVIAVAIAFNTPDGITNSNDSGPLAEGNGSSRAAEGTANPRTRLSMPSLGMIDFSALRPVLPRPNGGLINEARNQSEAVLEEVSGGLTPLVESAEGSANFLQSLIPLEALDNSSNPAD